MKTRISDLGSWKKQIEIEVDAEETGPVAEKVTRDYQKKAKLDGFRKGKAPVSLIEKVFSDAIRADAADELVQIYYRKAVEENRLAVVSQAKVQQLNFEEGKPFTFTVEVEVEPEVQVKQYTGIKVDKEIVRITEEDVKKTIALIQEQRAEIKPAAGPARKGSIVEGDVQAMDASGVPILGTKWEDRSFELGKAPLGDLIESQLEGAGVGEDRKFRITQSGRGPDGKQRETEDHYSIKIKAIRDKILPVVNDEFARAVGEYQSVADMEKDIQKKLEARRNAEAERMLRNRLADEVIKRNDFTLPVSMIETTLDDLWEDYQKQGRRQVDEEQFRKENRPLVIWNIKWRLVWHKIAEQESLAVSDEEIGSEIDKMAADNAKDEKKIRSLFKDENRRRRLKEELLEEKVLSFLIGKNKIKEVTLKGGREPQPILTR